MMPRFIPAALTALQLLLPASEARALPPAHFWSQWFGDTGFDEGTSVAVDGTGNVFVTGGFYGTVNFGRDIVVSAGVDDIFLAMYASNGTPQWAKRFGGTGGDHGYSVAVDATGNVFVTGLFTGTVDFGGGPLVSAGQNDIFLAKYDASGTHLWSKRFGGLGADFGNALAIDALGNVIVTGVFQFTVDFGGGALVSAGSYDMYIAKYNAAGTHQWSKRFGAALVDQGNAIAVDGLRNVFVTGSFQGTVDFGGGGLVSDSGSQDLFLAKYNESGVHVWSKRFGDYASEDGRALAVDRPGNVILSGTFQTAIDFGGGPLVADGGQAIILAKYAANGAHVWSKKVDGPGSIEYGLGVAVDGTGNIQLTGIFDNTVDFGGGPVVSLGIADIFHAKYDANGAHVWSCSRGDLGNDGAYAIALDTAGNAVLTGYFEGPASLGGAVLPGAGSFDIFLARYARDPAEPVISSVTDIGNDQGGKVKVRFNRSGHDQAASPTPITSYEVYRRDDPPPAFAHAEGAELPEHQPLIDGWTYVGTVPPHGETTYGIDVPTIGDSTIALGQYYSVFFIRGVTGSPYTFFDSPADSGYSLDNLAPGTPQNLFLVASQLFWTQPPTVDFDYFTVYGANTNSFGAATVIGYTVAATLNVTPSPYVFYFVTATDFSGNESLPGSFNTATGVGGTPKNYVLSVSNFPNPFNPRTTVSYTVPVRGHVTVAIYDARGGRVATLVDNDARDAGPHRIEWNGRADSGAVVPSGIYFARIEQNGAVRTKKMVLLK